MNRYAKVRKADNLVVDISVLSLEQAAKFPTDATVSLIEITEAQYDTAIQTGLHYEGSSILRFGWNGTNFIVNPDTRPVVTFTPTEIKAEIGDVVSVQVDISTGVTGQVEFRIGPVPLRADFVAGQSSIGIETSRASEFIIGPNPQFNVGTPLHVIVFARKLGLGG